MNAAHSHLIINHFPIIGLILGLLVLLVGIILKSSVTRRAALFVLLVSAITSFPSFSTGDGAEEVLEHQKPTIACSCSDDCPSMNAEMSKQEKLTHHLIHEHEEKAEKFMPFMWGIVALSLLGLILEWKNKKLAPIVSVIVLIIGVIASYFGREVGNSGGEISHPEIRVEKKK
ncbi:MAG: hypothetical protein ACK46Y_02845 [Fluviicola sp.]